MNKRFIITATGTDIGKTLTSAIILRGLDADYWKPIQCGTDKDGNTDTQTLKTLTQLPSGHFHREGYAFHLAASPHMAAESEGVVIDLSTLTVPTTPRTLLIEGAGGLMVPITRKVLMIDFFQTLAAPIILCARTELGTINHTLLSVEALARRGMSLHGIVFLGPEHADTLRTIMDFTKLHYPAAKQLAHIPLLQSLSHNILEQTFNSCFDKRDFS